MDRITTAAVGKIYFGKAEGGLDGDPGRKLILLHYSLGVLKAIHCGDSSLGYNRITKDIVVFNASDFPALVEKLQLDLHEPPMSQVIQNSFVRIRLYSHVFSSFSVPCG